ncbi:ATP-binding protein [Streptomyces sp. NPDC002688]|uniref:ATP-binding protein n=1 Tax=Streptomyces sp. NPDC002688 TaxID=3154423 RepID=UPI003327A534
MQTDRWQFEVPTAGSRHLPPSPEFLKGIASQGYSFEVAIADLVDNSLDAEAKDVVIHFLRDGDRLTNLLVVDDGQGMTERGLDRAMTVGSRREYSHRALGMFGTGLKSASFSQAHSVTVVSRTKTTAPVGRQWVIERAESDFQCDIVTAEYAQTLVDRYSQGRPIRWQGTIVRWDQVRDFPKHGDAHTTDRYLSNTIDRLGRHLGLTLHRFLARQDFNITIAVEDVRTGTVYQEYGVQPLDPFSYLASGRRGYPRTYTAVLPDIGEFPMTAHIWPARSSMEQYRGIGSLHERQGFYFYLNDRLVQAGGWNGFREPETHLSLARVEVDLPKDAGDMFRLTVKKSGVEAAPLFAQALYEAKDADGHTFPQYLATAEAAYREGRQRAAVERKEVIAPGKGLPPQVKDQIAAELPLTDGQSPIAIRWERLTGDHFFELDLADNAICLNTRYRAALLVGRRGGSNDAPMIKSLLYLLMNECFGKRYLKNVTKDKVQVWQGILTVAAQQEMARFEEGA